MISLIDFLNLDPKERFAYFEKASPIIGLPAHLIEKDFWVSYLLSKVFSLEGIGEALTFKGGTSLSKVYNLIHRFSEDIDLSIEKQFLGFDDKRLPENASSKSQRKKLRDELVSACETYVSTKLLNDLKESIAFDLRNQNQWHLGLEPDSEDKQAIIFNYPKIQSGAQSYVAPAVKMEFGARAEHWPTESQNLTSYIHKALEDALNPWSFNVRVLKPVRTFWEKATILYRFCHYPADRTLPIRQSRHYYDLLSLINSPVKAEALADINLLHKVCEHKSVYFEESWVHYENIQENGLKLIPPPHILKEMEADYREMEQMFTKDTIPWNEIIDGIASLEKELAK